MSKRRRHQDSSSESSVQPSSSEDSSIDESSEPVSSEEEKPKPKATKGKAKPKPKGKGRGAAAAKKKAPAKKTTKRKRNSTKPKRPKSAYCFFQQDIIPKIKAENGGDKIPFSEMSKEVSTRWASLDEKEKKVFAVFFSCQIVSFTCHFCFEISYLTYQEIPKDERKR